jgi:hypothetical protein
MAVNMNNAISWDVTPYGSCKNRRFRGKYGLHHQVGIIGELGTKSVVTNKECVLRLLVTDNVFPSSPILITMMMEDAFSETSVLTRTTRLHIPGDDILQACNIRMLG